jgi:ABC-type transporter lipoprotein component MlaA
MKDMTVNSEPYRIRATALRMLAVSIFATLFAAAPAMAQDAAPITQNPARESAALQGANEPPPPPGEQQGVYSDPLAPFNEAMFTFNLKLDASGYAYVAPVPVRESVKRFFDNVDVIPRFANNLFQLRLAEAGGEVARFGINSTLGLAGFFDPADAWFGLKEHPDDFGLTLRYYGMPTGAYVMLPFFGPSTLGDTVGLAVDGAMNPMSYLVPWYVSLSAGAGPEAVIFADFANSAPRGNQPCGAFFFSGIGSRARRESAGVLPCVVRAAHQRSRFDVPKAHRKRLRAQVRELPGRDVARDRQMLLGRTQILPQRQDVAFGLAQIAQHCGHLRAFLAQPEHQARLGQQLATARAAAQLRVAQDAERSIVASAGTRGSIQARDRLDIVVVNIDR